MHNRIDPLIARIALSLYVSGRKVERLPKVTEVQPWERADIVKEDSRFYGQVWCPLAGIAGGI